MNTSFLILRFVTTDMSVPVMVDVCSWLASEAFSPAMAEAEGVVIIKKSYK